jgi:hypothetical protein
MIKREPSHKTFAVFAIEVPGLRRLGRADVETNFPWKSEPLSSPTLLFFFPFCVNSPRVLTVVLSIIIDDDTWATDTSAEAVEKRKADLLGNTLAKTLVVGDETAEENGDARTAGMKELSEFVSSTPAPKVAETVKKIKEIAARESWKDTRLPQMIFASLFDNFKEIAKQVKARSKYLAPVRNSRIAGRDDESQGHNSEP